MIPNPGRNQEDMSPAEHHAMAATAHEAAARSHREAAKAITPDKQAHHAHIAQAMGLQAAHHEKMAAIKYADGKT